MIHKLDNIELKLDNTKVDVKIPILPDNSNIIIIGNLRIRRKPQALLNPKGVDLRTDYLKKLDLTYKENLILLNLKLKDLENALNTLGAFTTFIMPSTHIGPLFRNNSKSYTDNWLSGEGSGSTIGNVAIDILTPFAIGGAKSLATNAVKRFPYNTNTSRFLLNSSIRWPWMKQKLFYLFSPELLSELKKEFLLWMSLHGLEFKGARKYPKLASDILKGFLRPGAGEIIVPKDRSDIGIYLDWMDLNFNISTPREAQALPANSFKKGVMGDYNYGTEVARINTAYPLNAGSTFIHELGSHGTDMLVADRVIENYPFTLRFPSVVDFLRADIGKFRMDPTVLNIYSNIASISPGLGNTIKSRLTNKNFQLTHGTNFLKDSNKWYEARSTLNEIRARLFKFGDFPNSLKHLEKAIDQASDERILDLMRTINSYGDDYYRAYNLLPSKLQKLWMRRVRHALKYLPATIPFTFSAILNTNEE